ncbi:flagellar basal body rod protein FlgC [Aureibacillus halotolerans]|uniref:Flagellar basal-body rod protein FlgC n=1 Tax=Aureibacillus halotolerans TaxID=1508390 RepID=A0A4R6U4E3_9BACI|nr:flagellar basal body rod protein FlgC [Aureibacillus halotolerans]TDQ39643.1 flagellar basal-body rod protein FlgC [Aureibacillus halotolerans]
MSLFTPLHISASALTTQRLKMDVISSNIANANSTRAQLVDGEWQPYRRKMVAVAPGGGSSFSNMLSSAQRELSGVRVTGIVEDETPFIQQYNPTHPDANELGYVQMPNVDPLKEMVDLMSATRSYEANVTVLNASKGMLMKTLEIGK